MTIWERTLIGLGAASVVALLTGPILAHTGLVPPLWGYALFALAGPVGLVVAVAAAMSWLGNRQRTTLAALLLGACGAAPIAVSGVLQHLHPSLADVSTSVEDPPDFSAVSIPYPNDARHNLRAHYPELQSLTLASSREHALNVVRSIAEQQDGWHLTNVDPLGGVVEGIAISDVFRFKRDFVIRIRDRPEGVVIDARFRVRTEPVSIGAPARQVRWFMAAVREAAETPQK